MQQSAGPAHTVMVIEDVQVTPIQGSRVDVSALCDGHRLYYRLPASRLSRRAIGDALLVSALAPAMRAGSAIRLPDDLAISSPLASQLDGAQRVWASWNPDLHHVRLEASRYEPTPATGPVGLFYAGGVDSSYSLIAHLDEIDLLVLVFGFDHTMSDDEMHESFERNRRFAASLGKEIVSVETNHSRFVFELGVSRTFIFGATLAACALLLGLKRAYIASSHSAANLMPQGSHPVLDPRFSNGATEIVHDDTSVTRLEKTRAIAERPEFLQNLRVCWELPNDNCGVCPKCLRTMTSLRLCGAEGPFPPLGDVRRLREMAANSEVEYTVGMLMAARARGEVEIERELRKGLRRHDLNEALRYLDRALTGGWLQRRRRSRGSEADLVKVKLRPDLE
jgi:hypothetical protein